MQTVLSESSTEEFNSAVLAVACVVDVARSVGKDDDEDEDEDADEDAEEDEDIVQIVVESTTDGLGSVRK